MRRCTCRGQSAVEHAVLVAVVVLAAVAMQTYIKFADAGRLKAGSDNLNITLFNPDASQVAFRNCQQSTNAVRPKGGRTTVAEETGLYLTWSSSGPSTTLPKCFWE